MAAAGSKRPCLVTGQLLPWTGGPLKSIAAFQRGLDANVVSFVDRRHVADHALPMQSGSLSLVPSRPLPAFRHFLWPERTGLAEAGRLLAESAFASCHSFYTYHPVWMYRMCRKLAMPYWIVPHGILDPYVAGRNRIVKSLYMSGFGRSCLAASAATIFSSRAERDKATAHFQVARPVVIHWPVAMPAPFDRSAARTQLRHQLTVADDASLMLFLGRLHPMKRPLETIRLFAAGADPRWHLLLVGYPEGISAAACLEVARDCGVRDRVHVIPGLASAEVGGVIRGCDLFVSYSQRENFNNAAAECLASGMPLLLSAGNDLVADIGPSPAIGLLPDSPADATAVIREWTARDDSDLVERGRIGAVWAGQHLSFEIFRARLLELRDHTLAGHD